MAINNIKTASVNEIFRDILANHKTEFDNLKNYRDKGLTENDTNDRLLARYGDQIKAVEYYGTNSKKAYKVCSTWLEDTKIPDVYKIDNFNFYTKALDEFFSRHGEVLNKPTWHARYHIGSGNGIQCWILLNIEKDEKWSWCQEKIEEVIVNLSKNGLLKNKISEKKRTGVNDRSIAICTVLTDSDGLGKPIDAVTERRMKDILDRFEHDIIEFENEINKL